MPFETTPKTEKYNPEDELPQHLAHKPVYALPYQAFDGQFAGLSTDMRYISIGLAQYDSEAVTVKTMRNVDSRWTRQAEELPLHRPIDMTLFLAKAIFGLENDKIVLPPETLNNQTSEISISRETERNKGEMMCYYDALAEVQPNLKHRLNVLLKTLQDLKDQNKI